MEPLRIVRDMQRPRPGMGISVETPVLGQATATPMEKGLHVTWASSRIDELRRGPVRVDARIGLDAEAAFVPLAVELRYASGERVDQAQLFVLRDTLAPLMRGECLAAGGESLVIQPDETLAALSAVSPGLDDADLSGAVERVIERLDTDPRLQAAAEADTGLRPALEALSRSLRPSGFGL